MGEQVYAQNNMAFAAGQRQAQSGPLSHTHSLNTLDKKTTWSGLWKHCSLAKE